MLLKQCRYRFRVDHLSREATVAARFVCARLSDKMLYEFDTHICMG